MNIYIVTMHRWGNRELHSYVLGAYSTGDLAKSAGEREYVYRGGKYEAEIWETTIDSTLLVYQYRTGT